MKSEFWITSIFVTVMVAIVFTFKLWLFGSLVVSGVKSLSDDCGKNYAVEIYVVNGNWFCNYNKENQND